MDNSSETNARLSPSQHLAKKCWASTGLTDMHQEGHGPRKYVQNGDHGKEDAPSPSVVHTAVQS